MGTDRAESTLQGVLVPLMLSDAHLWDAQSSYSQQGPRPADAVAQSSDSELLLQPTGNMTAGQAVRTRVQRSGIPGVGTEARIAWKNEADGSTAWRGHDLWALAAHEVLVPSTATVTTYDPCLATLQDGRIVCAYEERISSLGTYRVRVQVRETDGTWGAVNTLYETTTAPTSKLCPAVAVRPDGREVRIAHFVYYATERAQVRIYRAGVDDLTTWTTASEGALRAALATTAVSPTGYHPLRLRMAARPGQWLLMASLRITATGSWRDVHGQWASTDGLRYTLVEIGDPATIMVGPLDIAVHDGTFCVCYQLGDTDTEVRCARLGSAYITLTTAPTSIPEGSLISSTIAGSEYFEESEIACVVDDTARLWVSILGYSSTTLTFRLSDDGGQTWQEVSAAPNWYRSADASTRPSATALTHQRGRLVAAGNRFADPGTFDQSLDLYYIGGHTQVTLPYRYVAIDSEGSNEAQQTWDRTLLPFDLPANVTGWASTGAGTITLQADRWDITTTALQARYHTFTPTATQDLWALAVVRPISGGSITTPAIALRLTIADGSAHSYRVAVLLDGPGNRFVLYDEIAGAQVGATQTVTNWTSPVSILVAVDLSGRAKVWWRQGTLGELATEDRQWTTGPSTTTLTDGTTTYTTDGVVWGHIAASAASSRWLMVCLGTGQTGESLASFVNPTSLQGRAIAREGARTYLNGDLYVYGNAGPAHEGEEHLITVAYDHPVANLCPGIEQSPLIGWRSAAVASGAVPAQQIAVALNADNPGVEEEPLESDLVGVAVLNTNAAQFLVQRWTSGAWSTVATIDTAYVYTGTTRQGQILKPGVPSGASPHWAQDELKGWICDLGGGDLRRVVGNGAGTFDSGRTGKTAWIRLEGVDGTEATGSISLRLYPPSWMAVLCLNGGTAAGWRLVVSSQQTPDLDIRIGSWWLGPVFVFGFQHSWGRVLRTVPGVDRIQRQDRVSRKRKLHDPYRTIRFAWTDGLDMRDLEGDDPDPDFLTASTTGGAQPVASWDDVPYMWEGLVRRLDGPLTPLGYLPRLPRSTSTGTDVILLRRRQSFIAAEMVTEVQLEQVQGEETWDEVWRVASLVAEEVAGA